VHTRGRMMWRKTTFLAVLFDLSHKSATKCVESSGNLPLDRVMTRQELIKHGLMSDRYVN